MGRTSLDTKVVMKLADELERMERRAERSGRPDIGEEQIEPAEMRRRLAENPGERRAFLKREGVAGIRRLFGEGQ